MTKKQDGKKKVKVVKMIYLKPKVKKIQKGIA